MENNLVSKMINAQKLLKAPKGQKNTFGKYNYRSCEDILEAVKPLLADNGLLLTISDEIVKIEDGSSFKTAKDETFNGSKFYVKATATITDGDKSISVSAYAREATTKKGMDDAQITGATSSYARKYALNGLFAIDDTKDSDSNEYQANTRKVAPVKEVKQAPKEDPKLILHWIADEAKVKQFTASDMKELMKTNFGVESSKELNVAQAKKLLQIIKEM